MAWSLACTIFSHPRFPAPKQPPCGAGPALVPPPGPWRIRSAPAAGGTICAAQVCPPSCPTWGLRTLGRLWPPASPAGSCARDCHLRAPGRGAAGGGVAARGGAPFKRCQGLIHEKWPRAGANLSPEAAGAPRGWLLSGSAAVEGSLHGGFPGGIQPGGGVRVEGEGASDRRKIEGKVVDEGVARGSCSWDHSHWRRLKPGGTSVTPKGYPAMAGPPGTPSPGLSPKRLWWC